MRKLVRNVVSAVAPIMGVAVGIDVLEAAGIGFPPELAWDAWPDWVIFSALVYAAASACYAVAQRIGGGPTPAPAPLA